MTTSTSQNAQAPAVPQASAPSDVGPSGVAPSGVAPGEAAPTRFGPWQLGFPWNSHVGQLLDSLWHASNGQHAPSAEIIEYDGEFVVEVDLPGIAKDDIDIDVTGRRLFVRATRATRERTGILRHTTRITGEIDLDLMLPAAIVDGAVSAAMADGVLRITLPKTATAKTTRVAVD